MTSSLQRRFLARTPACTSLLAISVALATCLDGCAITQSVSISDKVGSGEPIEASITHSNFLGLSTMENFHEVQEDLLSQCKDGRVTGVVSQTWSRPVLFVIFENVRVTAYCVKE
jgi:hypothetical protein